MGQDVVGTIVSGANAGKRVWTPVGSSFAEYVTAPEWKTAPLPASVDPRDGVSMCTVALTCATLAREAYPVKKGDTVLIRAAAGGVGLVLTQVSCGAEVEVGGGDRRSDRRGEVETEMAVGEFAAWSPHGMASFVFFLCAYLRVHLSSYCTLAYSLASTAYTQHSSVLTTNTPALQAHWRHRHRHHLDGREGCARQGQRRRRRAAYYQPVRGECQGGE
jgi:hypothetical protein